MVSSFDALLHSSDNEQTKAMRINLDEPSKNVTLKGKQATHRRIQIV